jgi:hypothetical protein
MHELAVQLLSHLIPLAAQSDEPTADFPP